MGKEIEELRQRIVEILRDRDKLEPEEKKELGKLIYRFRGALGMSLTEFASHLGVTPQAVRLWESGGNQPRVQHIPSFVNIGTVPKAAAATESDSEAETCEAVKFEGEWIAIRPREYILEQETVSKKVWLFKRQYRFLASRTPWVRDAMEEAARRKKRKDGESLKFYFVFPDVPKTAGDSFRQLHLNVKPDVKKCFHGIEIDDNIRTKLAEKEKGRERKIDLLELFDSHAAWIIMEYDDEYQREKKKIVDVFVELRAAKLVGPPERNYESGDGEGEPIWVQLAQGEAETLYTSIRDLLHVLIEADEKKNESADGHSSKENNKSAQTT